MRQKEIKWDDIFKSWKYYCDNLYPPMIEKNGFKEVKVKKHKNPNVVIGNNISDWWPSEDFDNRVESLNNQGKLGVYWKTTTGCFRTANMLWDNNENLENQALIWIGAAIWMMEVNLPEKWYGDIYDLILRMQSEILKEMKNRNMWYWHNSTRNTLPITLNKHRDIFGKPSSYRDLIYLAAIDNILSRTCWTLVHVTCI